MLAKLGAAVVALAIAVAWTPNAVFGGVSNLKQERTVTAYIGEGEPPPPEATIRSDKAGKFDHVAKDHFMNELLDHDDAKTSQTSTIGDSSVSASGSFFADSSGDVVSFGNTIDAAFRVTARANYHLTMQLEFNDFGYSASTVNGLTLKLRSAADSRELVSAESSPRELSMNNPNSLSFSGTLAPGEYELLIDMSDAIAQIEEGGTYQLDFSVGTAPHAVPLPPAVWTGLVTLGALAVLLTFKARRACAIGRCIGSTSG